MFTLKDFLLEEVKPALGCTEPGAVALCVARACEELKDQAIESVEVTMSASIYKNGMYVDIPGTNGLKGNYVAAALGAVCGKSVLKLEVLKPCSSEAVKDALKMIDEGRIRIIPEIKRNGIFIKAAVVSTSGEQVVCIIEGSHTNITRVEKDGKIIEMVKTDNAIERLETAQLSVSEQIAGMSYREVLKVLDNMNAGDVEYIVDGVEMNMNIAEYGFANNTGLEYGSLIRDLSKSNLDEEAGLPTKIKAWCAAAADARMGGAPLPVMSSAGSGNHGITAILPVFIVGEHDGKSREEIAKAIALSHLTTSFIKSRMGRLSPVCGCSVAAGAGAAAGIAFLRNVSLDAAEKAVVIMIANLVGMICDGAKETCALKVGTGAIEAYYAAMLALQGGLASPQGIVEETIEKTVENAAQLNAEGMKDIDAILIHQIQRR